MAPPSLLHVHLAADGGICVTGPDQPSSWVTLDELRRLLEQRPGEAVVLSGEPDAPAARSAHDVVSSLAGPATPGAAPVETERPHGSTALMSAAAYGAIHLLDDLLARGVPLEAADRRGQTALHHAAARGQDEAVRRLLDAGAAIEARNGERKSPLWNAAAYGHVSTTRLLLERGADPTALGSDGVDPRGWAAVRGHDEAVALLRPHAKSLIEVDGDVIGVRAGGRIPTWYWFWAPVVFLAGVGLFGGRFAQDRDWTDVLGTIGVLVLLALPLALFLRVERGRVPSLVVDGEGIDVATGRRRDRVAFGAIRAAEVEPSSERPRRVRIDHADGTLVVPLDGRPTAAVIELLHRTLGRHGVALAGGWHLAFTDGSTEPVMHRSDPGPGDGTEQKRDG